MNAHIFKYELPLIDDVIELDLPDKYGLCDIHPVGDKLFMWAVVDIHTQLVKRYFKIVGTGHLITDIEHLYFLRTVVMPNGLVWHVFEIQESNV